MNQVLSLVVNLVNNTSGPGRQVTTTLNALGAAARGASSLMNGLRNAMSAFGKVLGVVRGVFGSFLAQMVAFEALKAAFSGLIEGAKALDELAKTSARLGVTTEQLSGLRQAADFSGVAVDKLNETLLQLGTRVDQAKSGNKELQKQFNALGVELSGSKGLNEILLEVSDGLKNIEDPTERLNVALKITGGAGQKAAQFLSLGSDAIKDLVAETEKFGGIVSSDVAANAEKLVDSMARLQIAFRGIYLTLAKDFFPVITSVFNGLAELIATYLRPIVEQIQNILNYILRLISGFISLVIGLFTEGEFNQFSNKLLGKIGELVILIFQTVRENTISFFNSVLNDFKTFIAQIVIIILTALDSVFATISSYFEGLSGNILRAFTAQVKTELIDNLQTALESSSNDSSNISSNMGLIGEKLKIISELLIDNPIFAKMFGTEQTSIERVFESVEGGAIENASDGIQNFGDVSQGVFGGITDSFNKLNEQYNTVSGLSQQVSGILVGGFNSIKSSATSAIEGTLTAKDAFKQFGRSIISTLISMAAQFLILIPILILFNVLSGGSLAASGVAATTAALGSVTGLGSGLAGLGGGAGAGAGAGASNLSTKSLPVARSAVNGGGISGSPTIVTINTLDSADLESYLSRPRNAEAMASALQTRSGSPTFRSAVQGAF